eukprot:gene10793-10869_t
MFPQDPFSGVPDALVPPHSGAPSAASPLLAHLNDEQLAASFQILDTQDQLSAIKRLCKQHNVDEERFPPKQLSYFIASCKEEGMRPGDVPTHDSDSRKKVEVYQLYEEQCQREGDAARSAGCSLHDGVSAVPGKAGANLGAFVAMVDVLREQTQGLNLRGIIEQMLESSGLVEHYRTEKEGADRIENLEELVNAAESFVTQEGFGRDAVALPLDEHGAPLTQSAVSQGLDPNAPVLDEALPPTVPGILDADTGETLSPLAAFLTHAALEAGDNQAQAGQDAVQLMTVHASKGLEFDAVFIGGMEEGLVPHENSANERDGLEEERRLMYVAITRARKRLYLSYSQTRMLHGQTRYNIKSRFFDELPESALKWITPKQQGFGTYAPNSGAGSTYGTSARGSFGFKSDTFASPAVPAQKTAPAHGLRAGLAVFHTKFGEGKVLAIEGTGDDARAQVNFPRHGTKWLALSVAKLTVVD